METRKCKFCSEDFLVTRPWQDFCSNQHRLAWHTAERARGSQSALEIFTLRGEVAALQGKLLALQEEYTELKLDYREQARELAKYVTEPAPMEPAVDYIPHRVGEKFRTPPQPIKRKPFTL